MSREVLLPIITTNCPCVLYRAAISGPANYTRSSTVMGMKIPQAVGDSFPSDIRGATCLGPRSMISRKLRRPSRELDAPQNKRICRTCHTASIIKYCKLQPAHKNPTAMYKKYTFKKIVFHIYIFSEYSHARIGQIRAFVLLGRLPLYLCATSRGAWGRASTDQNMVIKRQDKYI